jgi:hypothetical protein
MNLVDTIPAAPAGIGLPGPLSGLHRVALNLQWRRDRETRALFEALDPELWARGATPMQVLMSSTRLAALAANPQIVKASDAAVARLDKYLEQSSKARYPKLESSPIAYFCAEFGLQSRIALYCGGLGSWQAIIASRRRTWAFPLWPWGCSIGVGSSSRCWTGTGRSSTSIRSWIPGLIRCSACWIRLQAIP